MSNENIASENVSGEFTRFCQVSELPPESKKAAKINNQWVLVCHTDGKILAVSNVCSHQVKPLLPGRMRNCLITCPVHGSQFNLETGEALNLPATQPLPTYEVRIVDDWIEVKV